MSSTTTTTTAARTAATWITRTAYAIAGIGVAASYTTQVALLHAHEVSGAFAWVLPSTLDLLAVAATVALQLPALDRASRRIAAAILVTTVAVSVAANLAGGTNAIERGAHAWPILAYLAGELLANRVRAYAARLAAADEAAARRSEGARKAATTRAAKAVGKPRTRRTPVEAIEALTSAAPVSPAPIG